MKTMINISETEVAQTLGTEFGDSTNFNTTNTTFERNTMLGMITIYYDTAKNLTKKGIVLKTKHDKNPTPNPFPAMEFCKPPSGWTK